MKICVVSTAVFSLGPYGLTGYGGLEHIAWHCAKGLAERGHKVTLIAADGSTCPGVQVVTVGPPTWNEEETYGGWPEQRDGDKIVRPAYGGYWPVLLEQDVILDHGWSKWAYTLKEEGRLTAPVLGVMHAPVDTMYRSLPPIERPCAVCISHDQADHYKALFNHEARVCHNGVDMDFYRPMDIPRTDRFLFLARFSTIKGPDLALEACHSVGASLDLIGDTSITGEPELYERCRRLAEKDPERLHLIGPANRGNCVFWMSRAHAFLHPNQRFREPFGLAPVEAQACGLPVICWNNGALRETVKDGETGWLVRSMEDLSRRIKEAQRTPGEPGVITEVMRKRCREWAGRFSIQNMVSRYEALCQEAVETGGW